MPERGTHERTRSLPSVGWRGWIQSLSHIHGYLLFAALKVWHRDFVRSCRPLALHLENEVFPALRTRHDKWINIHFETTAAGDRLVGTTTSSRYEFPGTEVVAQSLRSLGVECLRLDTMLEFGQIVEVLLMLVHASHELPDASPAEAEYSGWNPAQVASAMVGPGGYHKVCANMRFDRTKKQYEVEYTYCELFFSRVVRSYVERGQLFKDHRVLFSAAPRIALLVLALFLCAGLALVLHQVTGLIVFALLAVAVAATVWMSLYTIGSYQYTQEHHEQLIESYYRRAMNLARFPETMTEPVMKLGMGGKVLYLNPATEGLLQALGLRKGDVGEILPEDYRELVSHSLNEHVEKHETEVTRHGRTFRYVFAPFPDESAVIVVGSDVTYLKDIENELRMLNTHLEELVEARTDELQKTQDVTILCLAGLAELRDKETGEHLQRVRLYVRTLAQALRDHPSFRQFLTGSMIEKLYKSAPLHDIGKVGVPDAILLKPGQLDPLELAEMRRHTVHGGDALRWAEDALGFDSFLSVARDIAYYHHEKWDGSGYPHNLRENDIPPSARLMSLADVYDALTTRRVYKEAFSHEKAKDIILQWKGTHFDPDVVDAFLQCEDAFIEIAEKHRDPIGEELLAAARPPM